MSVVLNSTTITSLINGNTQTKENTTSLNTLSNNVNNSIELNPTAVNIGTILNFLNSLGGKMYFSYYIYNLIMDNSAAILHQRDVSGQAFAYSNVLQPIIDKRYSTYTSDLVWVEQRNLAKTDQSGNICYIEVGQYKKYQNNTISGITDLSDQVFFLNSADTDYRLLTECRKNTIPDCGFYTAFGTYNWTNGPKQSFYIFMKDILDNTKWISIGSGVDYKTEIENPNISFIDNNIDLIIEGGNRVDSYFNYALYQLYSNANRSGIWKNNIDYTWTYVDTFNINKMVCKYSKDYPDWSGNYVGECFIPESNFNVKDMMVQIMTTLNSFPTLGDAYVVAITYQIENDTNIAFIQIDKDENNNKIFHQVSVDINIFYGPTATVFGDMNVQGSLKVESSLSEYPIIQTDSVKKTTCFYEKVGINVQPFQVNALLDIDNLSNTQIINLIQSFTSYELNSYYVINRLFDNLYQNYSSFSGNSFENQIDALFVEPDQLLSYQNDVAVFTTPIKNTTANIDISFLHVPLDPLYGFTDRMFDSSYSCPRISQIVNEVKQMLLLQDVSAAVPEFKFSFVELLNDTVNHYMTSIRAVVSRDKSHILYAMSFLPVQSILNNSSYANRFTKLVESFSSLNRMLNYSCLLLKNNATNNIYTTITSPSHDSVNSFTHKVDNGSFNNRFGLNNTYVYALTSDVLQNHTLAVNRSSMINNVRLFTELHPEQNGLFMRDFFLPNTDIALNEVSLLALSYYQNNYGFDKTNQNFATWFQWERQEKIAFHQIISIGGKNYLVGTGIDLVDFIDKSLTSHGDVISAGQLTVSDDNQQDIFKVDTVKKTISNMYKVGVGLKNPNSTLDVNDSGIQDIINVIQQLATNMSSINYNYTRVVNAIETDVSNGIITENNDIVDPSQNSVSNLFINGTFKNAPTIYNNFTETDLSQNVNRYFTIAQINPYDLNSSKLLNYWLYPYWQGIPISKIHDPNNQYAVNIFPNIIYTYANNLLFNNSLQMCNYPWIFGEKTTMFRTYVSSSNTMYYFSSGVNVQYNSLRANTNQNVIQFTGYLNAYSNYLNYIILHKFSNQANSTHILGSDVSGIPIMQIDVNEIPNYEKSKNYVQELSWQYPLQSTNINKSPFGCLQILLQAPSYSYIRTGNYDIFSNDISWNDITGSTFNAKGVSLPPFVNGTYDPSLGYFKPIVELEANNRYKWSNAIYSILTLYPTIQTGDSGIIAFDDLTYDYTLLFYCTSTDNDQEGSGGNYANIIFVCLSINDIIAPTVNIKGDTVISGDFSLRAIGGVVLDINGELFNNSGSITNNYVYVDPDNEFFSVGSNSKRLINYDTFSGTLIQTSSKQNALISSDKYPNVVCETYADNYNMPISIGDLYYTDSSINLFYGFDSQPAMTVKRTSANKYSFIDISNHLCDYNSELNNYSSNVDPYNHIYPLRYGVHTSYELCDNKDKTIIIGDIGLCIEGLKYESIFGNTADLIKSKAGFQVNVCDRESFVSNCRQYRRPIFYVDNGGNATSNSLFLNGDSNYLNYKPTPAANCPIARQSGATLTVSGDSYFNHGTLSANNVEIGGSLRYSLNILDSSSTLITPLSQIYTVKDLSGSVTITLPNPSESLAGTYSIFKRTTNVHPLKFTTVGKSNCIIPGNDASGATTLDPCSNIILDTNIWKAEFVYTPDKILHL